MARAVGIDLGATTSVVAVLEGGEPTIITGAGGARATPSVVAFSGSGEPLIGEPAARQAVANPSRTVWSPIRLIGTGRALEIDGNLYLPQFLVALLLAALKRNAEVYLGEAVTEAVITVPACYDDIQRQAVREAAEIAGLKPLLVITDTSAAAAAYSLEKGREDELVLLFDLGGGSLSVSLADVGKDDEGFCILQVNATSGDNHLGGDDWDQRIVDHLLAVVRRRAAVDLSRDEAAVQRLREAAERAKRDLSTATTTTVSLHYLTMTESGPVHLDEELTRAQFQQMTADLLERTKEPFRKVIADAGVQLSQIDHVVLVGGSTRMPAVAEVVRELTGGKEPNKGVNPDEVVAVGAALRAGTLKGERKDLLLIDATSLGLGIASARPSTPPAGDLSENRFRSVLPPAAREDAVLSIMIARNSAIPTKASEEFTTAEDNQPSVLIQVFQGERSLARENKPLGTFELTGIAPAPRGVPQIEVTFDVDANGILHVSAKDRGTGKELAATISQSNALPQAEIDRMAREVAQWELLLLRTSEGGASRRRALTIGVSGFRPDQGWEDLPEVHRLVRDVGDVLRRVGFHTRAIEGGPLTGDDLGRIVRQEWDDLGADGLLVVHVVTHGLTAAGGGTIYALGVDGVARDSCDIGQWLTGLQNVADRPLTLFLLDLCSAGIAARLPWQERVDAANLRGWVIAACQPDQAAFDGRFSQALTAVLASLFEGGLDVTGEVEFVPLDVVARAVRREVNRLAGLADSYSQQVTATLVDMSSDPRLPFFRNPGFTAVGSSKLRSNVDPGLVPFLDDLDEALDVRHFLERASGSGGEGDAVSGWAGCFTGRDDELRRLSPWLNGQQQSWFGTGPLSVVTGGPGAGKSALLGVLVCAAHPKLREPTRPLWDRVSQAPYAMPGLVAVHARGLAVDQVVRTIGRQLQLSGSASVDGLIAALEDRLHRPGLPEPVIVVDAVDEASDGPAVADLVQRIIAARGGAGESLARVLIGVRPYSEYESLMDMARDALGLVDLDAVDARVLENDLNRYVTDLLRTEAAYRAPTHAGFTGALAAGLAVSLSRDRRQASGTSGVGPFLLAGLYTRHIVSITRERPESEALSAARFVEEMPRNLTEVLDIDLNAHRDQPWLRPIMLALSVAHGSGMPASVIARVAGAIDGQGRRPTVLEVQAALRSGKVYIRQASDLDHSALYRLFHQGLVEALRPEAVTLSARLFEALLEPAGRQPVPDWAAVEPYVLRHVHDHARDAGSGSEVDLPEPALLAEGRLL